MQPWSLHLKIIAFAFHSTAIASTIFRLVCRWRMARSWWEDGWAAFALVLDILCLATVWLEMPMSGSGEPQIDKITNWIAALTFTSVLWVCRLSILFSIVRLSSPSKQSRRIACLGGCSFVIMWVASLAQRIQICLDQECRIAGSVAASELITDVLSDSFLVAMPICLLRRAKLTRRQRILIYSVFSATLLITAVTILHAAVLFTTESDGIIVIGHVQTALSLIVCNLLVIVTFVYRIFGRDKAFHLDVFEERVEFTTVDLSMGIFVESIDGTESKRARTLLTPNVTRNTEPPAEEPLIR